MNRAALVCLLVLLAGCNALPGTGGNPTERLTAAPLPTDTARAPGLSPDGVEAPERIGSAHEEALRNESYTLYSNRTVRYANGTLRSQLVVRVRVDENRTYLASVRTAGGSAPVLLGVPPARATFWSNGSLYLRAFSRGNGTTYNRFRPPEPDVGTWRYWTTTVPFGGEYAEPETFYAATFASIPTDTVDRVRVDGSVVHRVTGDRARSSQFDERVTRIEDVRLVAAVREDGLVRTLSLAYTGRVDGTTVRVRWTVRYRAIGRTSVGKPPWFEKAAS